jgi:hypothetical protein
MFGCEFDMLVFNDILELRIWFCGI